MSLKTYALFVSLFLYSKDQIQILGEVIDCGDSTFTYCTNSTISCPSGTECTVDCDANNMCDDRHILCPEDNECIIHCDAASSCSNLTIRAETASKLELKGCTATDSCVDVSIYCPVTDEASQCILEGDDDLGSSNEGLSIFAVQGFDDIEVEWSGSASSTGNSDSNGNSIGTVYCESDYSSSCNITISSSSDDDTTSWSCSSSTSECAASTSSSPSTSPSPSTTDDDESSSNNNTNGNNNSGGGSVDGEIVIIVVSLVLFICFIGCCCWYNKRAKLRARKMFETANRMKHSESGFSQTSYSTQNLKKGPEREPINEKNTVSFDVPDRVPMRAQLQSPHSRDSNRSHHSANSHRSRRSTGSRQSRGSRHSQHSQHSHHQSQPQHLQYPAQRGLERKSSGHSNHSHHSHHSHRSHNHNANNNAYYPNHNGNGNHYNNHNHNQEPQVIHDDQHLPHHPNHDSTMFYENPHNDGASVYDDGAPNSYHARSIHSDHTHQTQITLPYHVGDHGASLDNKRSPFTLPRNQVSGGTHRSYLQSLEDPPSPKSAKSAFSAVTQSTIQFYEEKNIEVPDSYEIQTVGPGPIASEISPYPSPQNNYPSPPQQVDSYQISVEDENQNKTSMTTPSSSTVHEVGSYPAPRHGGSPVMDPIVESPEHDVQESNDVVFIRHHTKPQKSPQQQQQRPPLPADSRSPSAMSPQAISPQTTAASGDLMTLTPDTSNQSDSDHSRYTDITTDSMKTKHIQSIFDLNGIKTFGPMAGARGHQDAMRSQEMGMEEMKSGVSTPTVSPKQSERQHVRGATTPNLENFGSDGSEISTVSAYSEVTERTTNTNLFAPNTSNHKMDGVIDVIAEDNAMDHDPSFDTMKSQMKYANNAHLSAGVNPNGRSPNGKKGSRVHVSQTLSDYGPENGRSPDTWFDFDEENGIFSDHQETDRMLRLADDGYLAGSYNGM